MVLILTGVLKMNDDQKADLVLTVDGLGLVFLLMTSMYTVG
jgi:hypothetical protein